VIGNYISAGFCIRVLPSDTMSIVDRFSSVTSCLLLAFYAFLYYSAMPINLFELFDATHLDYLVICEVIVYPSIGLHHVFSTEDCQTSVGIRMTSYVSSGGPFLSARSLLVHYGRSVFSGIFSDRASTLSGDAISRAEH
jgi:hypothetical protein